MKYLGYLILAFLVYFAIFWNLDYMPIRLWDESRLAINALEMHENGNFFVTYFDGLPDMWNTKPPLLIWLQVMMFNVFGISVLSFRLPSAIAALFTMIVILGFSIRYLKSFWFGFIAICILLSIDGYIELHSVRTGDYDALLTLFTTLSGLLFFVYSETKNNKYLVFFFIFLMFSVFTKGIAGLLFLPGLLFYSLWKKQVLTILTNKDFYIGVVIFIVPVLGIYLLREAYNHGYLAAVYNNEIGGRYFTEKNINNDFLYYFKMFTRKRLIPWYVIIPIAIAIGLLNEDSKKKKLTVFLISMVFPFLAIISFSRTKLSWYDVPAFPFIAMLIAVLLYEIFIKISKKHWVSIEVINKVFPLLFILSIIAIPYLKIIKKNSSPQDYVYEKRAFDLGVYLQDGLKGINDLNGFATVYTGYRPQIDFYHRILNKQGVNIRFADWEKLKKGDKVLAIQKEDKENIERKYKFVKVFTKGDLTVYQIE